MKATIQQLIESFNRTKSTRLTAAEFGMQPRSVWQRLDEVGAARKLHIMGEREKKELQELYKGGFLLGDGQSDAFCKKYHRTKQYVSRKAKVLGLTQKGRSPCKKLRDEMGKRTKKFFAEQGHPRGMLGKKHTDKLCEDMRKKSKARWESMSPEEQQNAIAKCLMGKIAKNGTAVTNRYHGSWKSGWRDIAGKKYYFRSRWEANYGRYLQTLRESGVIVDWKHEPKTFIFPEELTSYLPDFLVVLNDGTIELHEVKGWMDERSIKKLELMRKYYPEQKIRVIKASEYRELEVKVGHEIEGWEFVLKNKKKMPQQMVEDTYCRMAQKVDAEKDFPPSEHETSSDKDL